jgi:hypothetical protein
MANVDAPYGLKPVKYAWGAPYSGACRPYFVQSDYATALFIGDTVLLTGTSNTTTVRGFPPGTLPAINKAAITGQITGVIVGFLPLDGHDSTVHGPASTARIALVADDPDLLFSVQDDGSAALTAAIVGTNAQTIFTHAGSTFTGRSGVELDATTPDTTQAFQLRIVGLLDSPGNELGANAQWLVYINNHSYNAGVVGAPVA